MGVDSAGSGRGTLCLHPVTGSADRPRLQGESGGCGQERSCQATDDARPSKVVHGRGISDFFCPIRGLRSPIHQQDVLDESMSHSNTFLTEGSVSGGGANSESLSPDQLENISETKLRRAQVIVT